MQLTTKHLGDSSDLNSVRAKLADLARRYPGILRWDQRFDQSESFDVELWRLEDRGEFLEIVARAESR